MSKEFIPYEEALALKELGFDEECLKSYHIVEKIRGQEYIELKEVIYDNIIELGVWYHVVVTYDGSSDISGVNTYVNGISQVQATLGNNLSATVLNLADLNIICHAPLYQQAFRWFRQKHGLFSEINLTTKQEDVEEFQFFILNLNEPLFESDDYKKYEEAELACLKKLINIVKPKQNNFI